MLIELMEKIKMPSDAQLMQIAIDDLNNSSLPLEDHHRALQELLILVEPIDNAIGKCSFILSTRAEMAHLLIFLLALGSAHVIFVSRSKISSNCSSVVLFWHLVSR
ncbi:unnamed protein product [Ilex paraguariensis]|uniref:Nucleotide exchange factor Fes1 domain-containing protein n=1 Tax=Ilex paraguariensis TaxID=185542 RepID=A0ABC8RTA2_9AQUA